MKGNIDMPSNKIINLGTQTTKGNPANVNFVNQSITNNNALIRSASKNILMINLNIHYKAQTNIMLFSM